MHIIGTAGHVDHGKSSLVRALTGTDPDRWLQEQQRGMTLDLGFAHLRLAGGDEAGIVDVPGHERFLHNMLAGAAGMELLLLVIAANEGVMPQTTEHLQILRYLNVAKTIVVVSKSDLLSEAELAHAQTAMREALKGTIAADAPMVAVSTLTEFGLESLRATIAQTLATMPARAANAPVYLPIDRVFTLPGRGTIVTGTLMQGSIAVGDVVSLAPGGKHARVRTMQVFGESRDRVDAGTRVALNIPSLACDQLARGDTVAGAELPSKTDFSVQFTPLASAVGIIKRKMPVRAYFGSGEILGTLVFEQVPTSARAVRAQLHLRAPTVAFPGLRFVLRQVSPKTLLGGGETESVAASTALDGANTAIENMLLGILRERGLQPTESAQAAFLANLREEAALDALESLADRGELLRIERPAAYVDAGASRELLSRVIAHLVEAQTNEPWAMGVTSLALSRALSIDESTLVRVLAAFADEGRLMKRAGYYATMGHEPGLSAEQKAFFDALVILDPERPSIPSDATAIASAVRTSEIVGASKAYDTLLARGVLIKVGDDLYRGSQIAAIHAKLVAYLEGQQRMTMAEFRDLLGTSRKYAVPLLEWFDGRGITVRSDDVRMLRRKGGGSAPV